MTSSNAALVLSAGTDPADWMRGVLEGWGLPGGLARGWMPVVASALPTAAELALEHDAGMGLVSVEARDADGRVLVGLDDLVGGALGGLTGV